MKLYEIAVVLHPDLEIDLDRATGKVEKIIESAKGKIVKRDNWGKRKLAYKIKKQDWGIYIFYHVKIDPAEVSKIDASFRITSEIMRYLVVSLDGVKQLKKKADDKSSKSKPKEDSDVDKVASEKANDEEKK